MSTERPQADERKVRALPGPVASCLALLLLIGAPALAFHDGGVAECKSCHVMHRSEDGLTTVISGGNSLIRGATASELCLTCHAQTLGSVLAIDPLAPPPEGGGGNFVFLLEDNLNDSAGGASSPIPGDAAGHNIVAPGYGLLPDSRYTVAPGGGFPSTELSCTSCHDPHGGTSFRMLNGIGPVMGGAANFSNDAIQAAGTALGSAESPTNHTAYYAGVSNWCGNCHGNNYGHRGGTPFSHRGSFTMTGNARNRYNAYDGEANPTGGTQVTAYLPEVPFENPFGSITDTAGPISGSSGRMMCLTCHRAHASSAPSAGRWDFNVSLLAEDGVASGSYAIPDPYSDPAQVGLCAKCHDDHTNP